MPLPTLDSLNAAFNEGQEHLSQLVEILATRAGKLSTRGNLLRVAIILLGALAATRETAEKIAQGSEKWIVGSYAAIGVLTTIVGGTLAAFKFDTRGAELKVLAAESQASRETLKIQWSKVGFLDEASKQLDLAMEVLHAQVKTTDDLLAKASSFTNITRKILKEQDRNRNKARRCGP